MLQIESLKVQLHLSECLFCRWQVAFDDGNKIYVRAKDILVVSKIPRGHSVLAKADEEILDYQPALIKHAHEDGFLYEIQFTDDQTESQ